LLFPFLFRSTHDKKAPVGVRGIAASEPSVVDPIAARGAVRVSRFGLGIQRSSLTAQQGSNHRARMRLGPSRLVSLRISRMRSERIDLRGECGPIAAAAAALI
jgi:hypothetical protein